MHIYDFILVLFHWPIKKKNWLFLLLVLEKRWKFFTSLCWRTSPQGGADSTHWSYFIWGQQVDEWAGFFGGHWEPLLPLHPQYHLLEWVRGNKQDPLRISFLWLLSGLKQHTFILLKLWNRKSKINFTGPKSRCWQGNALREESIFLLFQLLKLHSGEFPGDPAVRTPHFHCPGPRLYSRSGN